MKRWAWVLGMAAVGCGGGGGGGGGFDGIPTEMVPNLRAEEADDLRISTEDIGNGGPQKLLRLASKVSNWGDGPIEIFGEIQGADHMQLVPAFQRIRWNNGDITSIPAGDFEHHDIHGHWHWENLMSFKLAAAVNPNDPYDGANTVVGVNPKVSFCLVDTEKIPNFPGEGQPGSRRYRSCGQNTQGISVGWIDVYTANLYGQWIVIDGVPDGVYWLIVESDPTGLLTETDETDNRNATKIRITGNTVTEEP